MRIVSLAPSCTEIVFALGCGDQLIGRTAFCDYPPEVANIPSVGGWTTANLDAVRALAPDLVLTSTFLQDAIAQRLRAQGIAVCHTDPRTLADVLTSFEIIAAALGVPDQGRALRAHAESEFSSLPSIPNTLPPRIYAEEWPDPPMVSGNWVPDLLAGLGMRSLLPAGERSRTVTIDEIRAFDPDIILLNYCGMARVPPSAQVARIAERPGWETLRALRARRVVPLDDDLLNRPGPRLVDGLRAIRRVLEGARVLP